MPLLQASENAPLLPSNSSQLRHTPDDALLAITADNAFKQSIAVRNLLVAMEKVKASKLAYYVDKMAVESGESNLSHTEMMLNNHDLKPGELCDLPTGL